MSPIDKDVRVAKGLQNSKARQLFSRLFSTALLLTAIQSRTGLTHYAFSDDMPIHDSFFVMDQPTQSGGQNLQKENNETLPPPSLKDDESDLEPLPAPTQAATPSAWSGQNGDVSLGM